MQRKLARRSGRNSGSSVELVTGVSKIPQTDHHERSRRRTTRCRRNACDGICASEGADTKGAISARNLPLSTSTPSAKPTKLGHGKDQSRGVFRNNKSCANGESDAIGAQIRSQRQRDHLQPSFEVKSLLRDDTSECRAEPNECGRRRDRVDVPFYMKYSLPKHHNNTT